MSEQLYKFERHEDYDHEVLVPVPEVPAKCDYCGKYLGMMTYCSLRHEHKPHDLRPILFDEINSIGWDLVREGEKAEQTWPASDWGRLGEPKRYTPRDESVKETADKAREWLADMAEAEGKCESVAAGVPLHDDRIDTLGRQIEQHDAMISDLAVRLSRLERKDG